MALNKSDIEERVEAHDAFYVGTDGAGDYHCWSIYHWTVYVVTLTDDEEDVESVETWDLEREIPPDTLDDWDVHVEQTRGWEENRIGGLLEGIEVDAADGERTA